VRRVLVTSVVMLLAAACRGPQPSPVAPSAISSLPAGPPTPAGVTVRGIVYEVTADGRRPLPGAGVDISPEYQSWAPTIVTDADGRFASSAALGTLRSLKIIATKGDYSQPCRMPVQDAQVDHEVYLVSNDLLSATGAPSSMPIAAPILTGRVFERTSNGEQPVARASITLDFTGGDGWAPSATTITDAAGRYLLCNVVDATGLGIAAFVRKTGYRDVFVDVPVHAGGSFDVELQLQ
jgi:hypothetical protein